MWGLLLTGFLAGMIAGISPCVIPVLPVVLVAGGTRVGAENPVVTNRRRPLAVVLGLVVSFSLVILVGTEVLSALDLPQDILKDVGIGVLCLVGLGFIIPPLGRLIERPFAKLTPRQPNGTAGGFILGLTLGLVFVPCAGPVLSTISIAGTSRHVGTSDVWLTLAFGVGVAIPLLIIALAGNQVTRRVKTLGRHRLQLQLISGAILLALAGAIAATALTGLKNVPGYTTAIEHRVEETTTTRQKLAALTGTPSPSTSTSTSKSTPAPATLAKCKATVATLENCGQAPGFTGITAWLNTPGGKPLSLSQLKGKVVLVDFWTYSCINCQRTLPHVEAWYKRYEKYGLVIVGVHTPEFPFEHVVSNIRTAVAQLGVDYPVAIDNNATTWKAYRNEYWPADYLIDAKGDVRHISFGEGNYTGSESLIRQLLVAADPKVQLPPPTSVPNLTPKTPTNSETYVGYTRLQFKEPTDTVTHDAPAEYQFPTALGLGGLGFSGEWTEHAEEATADQTAKLELGFQANDVYLVLGGTGTVSIAIQGQPTKTITVSGIPRLYTLLASKSLATGTMILTFSPGVQAYDFTFG